MPSPATLRLVTRQVMASLLAVLLVVLTSVVAPSGALASSTPSAANPSPSPFEQGPASSDQLALYSRIASVNTCIATRAGQDFEQAAAVAGETIAQLILGVHKGLIQTSGSTPLPLEELRKGSINAAVIGATEICPKQVPTDLTSKVREALASQVRPPSS